MRSPTTPLVARGSATQHLVAGCRVRRIMSGPTSSLPLRRQEQATVWTITAPSPGPVSQTDVKRSWSSAG